MMMILFAGLVSESKSQMAEEGKMLGQEQRNGRIRAVWCNGTSLHPVARIHPQIGQGWHNGILRSLAVG